MPDTAPIHSIMPNAPDDQLTHLSVDELVPWAGNVRTKRTKDDIEAMAKSIETIGLINPLLVIRVGNEWNVVAGVTRLMALQKLGYATVPCIVLPDSASAEALTAVSLAENTSRTGMPMHDIVRALRTVFSSGIEDINEAAAILGQPIDTTKYAAQLTRLTDDALAKFAKGKIGTEFALEMSKLSHERQRTVLKRLKEFASSYSEDGKPDHMVLKRELARERVSADAVLFSMQQFIDAGGTVNSDLLGSVTYEPFSLVMQLQREAGQKLAEKLRAKHKWVDFFESSAENSYYRVYVHDDKNPKPEKAGVVVLLTPDSRIETRSPVKRIEDVKAKEKEAKQKEKEAAKADGKGDDDHVTGGINDFAAQYLAEFTRHSIAQVDAKIVRADTSIGLDVALAVILSDKFKAWPRQADVMQPSNEMFMASKELKGLRDEVQKFEAMALAKGGDLSVEHLLELSLSDLVDLLKVYAMRTLVAYKHDDQRCVALLKACGSDPSSMRMATLPVLKRLKREQLEEIAKGLKLNPTSAEPKGGLARRIEMALEKAEGGWLPPGISYSG